MNIVLHAKLNSGSLAKRYNLAKNQINNANIEIRFGEVGSLAGKDVLISHDFIDNRTITTYAGKTMGRVESLTLLETCGFPVVEWTKMPKNPNNLKKLFKTWGTDNVILKKSHEHGGRGWFVFKEKQKDFVDWNINDVICKEVNPNDGDFYKAELFLGEILISWKCIKPPIKDRLKNKDDSGHQELRPYGGNTADRIIPKREIYEFDDVMKVKLRALSSKLKDNGLGHVSLDLMKKPDGSFVAIELNTGHVATYWTARFPSVDTNFVNALKGIII